MPCYFTAANLPSQQETLGPVVGETLYAGQNVNRKSIRAKFLRQRETASTQ
ncbi:hypothetical protein [Pantoea sp. AS142]|uniref:hypothetical protein n=1 Tax=Pantoea sp. AS142 TaxID=3081292 RepID=UPI003017D3F3